MGGVVNSFLFFGVLGFLLDVVSELIWRKFVCCCLEGDVEEFGVKGRVVVFVSVRVIRFFTCGLFVFCIFLKRVCFRV